MNKEMTPTKGPVIRPKKSSKNNGVAFQKSMEDMYDEMGFPIDENFDSFLFI